MAVLASALVTLPVGLSADVAVNLVTNTADQSPLGVPNSHVPGGPANVPAALGATGQTPHDTQVSPAVVHDATSDPAALSTGAGPQADLPSGPLGIPGVVLDAYEHAQQVMAVDDPGCHLPWWLLAGIGKIESSQAEHGEVDANGTTLVPILGPELNGSNGFAAIPAINGGQWTGDPVWQRAVGPMQFLPSTWLRWGDGGNPNNVYDAALAAGRYLCAGGGDLTKPADQAAAVFSYNHSDSYVSIVLTWANAYRGGVTPLPETTALPQGPVPANVSRSTQPLNNTPTTPANHPKPAGGSTVMTATSLPPTSAGGGTPTSSGGPGTGTGSDGSSPVTTTTTTTQGNGPTMSAVVPPPPPPTSSSSTPPPTCTTTTDSSAPTTTPAPPTTTDPACPPVTTTTTTTAPPAPAS